MHEIYLSHRLSLRIPSLQDIEMFFIAPLRLISLYISRMFLIPIIPLVYSVHALLGDTIHCIGLQQMGRKIEISFRKIHKNVNRKLKQCEDSKYPHHLHILLMTLEYVHLIDKIGYFPNAVFKFIGGLFSFLTCIFIAPFLFIPLFLVQPIENITIPNQGFYEELKITSVLTLIQGFYIYYLKYLNYDLNIWNKIISFGLYFLLSYSLLGLIQHISLRIIMCCNGYIPWNYARFLNYCTERLFLQRVGGRYRFIHRLLQEHLARMS